MEINTHGKPPIPTLTTLTNPDRLVLDFQDAEYLSDIHGISVGRPPLKAVRISDNRGAKSPSARVVLDLTKSSEYDLQTLTNKLVVNLHPTSTPSRPQ